MKTVCQLNSNSVFVGAITADESPLEPGKYLLPGGAVDFPVPVIPQGSNAVWNGAVFDFIPIPIDPPVEPSVVTIPQVVSFFQGCAALQAGGYLEAVESYMSGPATAVEKLAWRTITEIRRASPLTSKLAAMLGLTDAQVDDLFILAATIEA